MDKSHDWLSLFKADGETEMQTEPLCCLPLIILYFPGAFCYKYCLRSEDLAQVEKSESCSS